MKNCNSTLRILVFFITLLTVAPSNSQTLWEYNITDLEPVDLIITYSLNWQQDSTNPEAIRKEDMYLFVGKNISKFMSKNNFISDTVARHIKTAEELQQMLLDPARPLPTSGVIYSIYKDYPDGKMTFLRPTIDGKFKFEEEMNLFNWQLTGDTATITGYKAQKATTDFGGRSWVAWFTPEIPSSNGPYKFNGLPGLIVKVSDTKNHYVFELKSIEKPDRALMIDIDADDFTTVTKQEYFKVVDAIRIDIISRAKEKGLSSSSQQTAARNLKKRNNPIELIRE